MHIQINTAEELTATDRAILLALAGVTETFTGVLVADAAETPTEEKPAPKKRAARKPKAEPTPEPEPEDLPGWVDEPTPELEPTEETARPTLDEVVTVATAFIRNGKSDDIKRILNEDLGVEKVTALKDSPEKLPELLDMLVDFFDGLTSKDTQKAVRAQIEADKAPLFLARTEG